MSLFPRTIFLFGIAAALAGAASHWRWPPLPRAVAPPPVPADNPMSAAKVALGRRLFYEADLSINGTMSCGTCHVQKHGFADDNRTRPGALDDAGRRNVPGLANVGWLPALTFADPGLTTLEAQVAVPLFGDHPVEMGMKGKDAELVRRLARDACYVRMFRKAFPETRGEITTAAVAKALGAFQRTLIAFDTPWDRARRGMAALPDAAARGERVFQTQGCATCHAGPNLTDSHYHRLLPTHDDRGLGETTDRAEDDGRFRTPGLRNVALTAPYLHDGRAATLEEAIAAHSPPIPAADMHHIAAFLNALTDQGFVANPQFALPDRACGKRL